MKGFAAFLAIVTATMTGIWSAGETGVDDKTISIGSCTDLGSPSGARGQMQILGAAAYFDYINAKGGVHGRKLKLISYDDKNDPELTVSCFQRLLDEDVFATAFFLGTPNAAKLVIVAQNQKVPVLGIISGAPFIYEPVKRYIFNYQPSVEDQINGLVDGAWNKLGLRKIGVIGQADAIGAAGLTVAREALAKYGASPVAYGSYPRGSLVVEPAVETLRAQGTQAVLLSALGPQIKKIVDRARVIGWKPLFMATSIDPMIDQAEGTVVAQLLPPYKDTKLPAVALFEQLMKKYPGAETGYPALMGFTQARLVVEGLSRAGRDLTREKYVDALESIEDLDIGFGPDVRVHFSPTNHKATQTTFYTVSRGGKAVPFTDWTTILPK